MGPKNGLLLYLDANAHSNQYKTQSSNVTTMKLALHHDDTFPLLNMGGLTIQAGKKTR